MSWLNFNESLSSIKGQLTTFASGVLADVAETENEVAPTKNTLVQNLERQQQINNSETVEVSNENVSISNNWSWETPNAAGEPHHNATTKPFDNKNIIHNLQEKIDLLENEKKELLVSLEQLDLDCQQTTDKLVTLKDNLQTSYNELKCDYEKLQKEYGDVLKENMERSREIENLMTSPSQRNESLDEVERKLVEERKTTESLQNLCDRLKEELAGSKMKVHDDTEALKKLKNENERLLKENESVKQAGEDDDRQLLIYRNNKLSDENEEMKEILENLQEELKRNENKIQTLQQENEQLKNEYFRLTEESKCSAIVLKQLKDDSNILKETKNQFDTLQNEYVELKMENSKLLEDYEKLKSVQNCEDDLKNKYEQLKVENKKLTDNNVSDEGDVNKFNNEKEVLHEKYLNIITETMKKYIDSDGSSKIFAPNTNEEPQILEFAGKVETLLKLLLDFKTKTESLEKELCEVTQEKNKIMSEKNFEIEKLLKNSEILSQEVIAKTQTIKDYEDECGELMKNNDLLISELQNYKNNSGLQTISESNEDNLLLLESQLENANKRIQDLELIISDLENSKQDVNLETQTELEYIKKQLNMTGQELSHSKEEYQSLFLRYNNVEEERQNLRSSLDKIKTDFENVEYKYTEININMEALKEDNEEHKNNYKKLESLNLNLMDKNENLQNIVDDLKQELHVEMENIKQKDSEMRNLVERLQNSKMCETKLKLQLEMVYKELQTISEVKEALEVKHSQSITKIDELEKELMKLKNNCNIEETNKEDSKIDDTVLNLKSQLENTNKEKDFIQFECTELKKTLSEVTQQNDELQQKNSHLELQVNDLTTSRNEIIALVTAKHQENIQYHNEIQRLNHLLAIETEKALQLEGQLHDLSTEPPSVNSQEELMQKMQEIEKLTDQNNFLREKCEVLAQNLLQEQANVQKVLAERTSVSEREQSLAKELERLRAHLVEIEEMYTQELLQAEQKNKDMQAKVNEIEQREKDSSSIYTSVSIRANQQVETLQTQLQLVTNQRDELRQRTSDLEDQNNKQVAALTNLQLVLEQFQKEREKDVQQETERIRRQIGVEKQVQQMLHAEINSLKMQLEESKQGLQAASRLSDQLEKSKQQIVSLKDEVTKLQEQLKTSDTKYKEISTQADTKVDKSLLKNLIIGYISSSHSNDQYQILKIIATVLDFNQKESDKVNLNKPQQGGWLSSILHPQSLNPNQPMSQQSLSEAFVRFLENESKPKVLPNLLISNQARKSEASSSSTTPRQSPSPLVLSEVCLPTFVDFGKSRNSSSILKDVLKDNS